jgi:hypothetical protein
MVENQHQKIKGYRDLSEGEIAALNECKIIAVSVGELIERVTTMTNVDHRWVAIAKTDLQKGFMMLIRAIARPSTF